MSKRSSKKKEEPGLHFYESNSDKEPAIVIDTDDDDDEVVVIQPPQQQDTAPAKKKKFEWWKAAENLGAKTPPGSPHPLKKPKIDDGGGDLSDDENDNVFTNFAVAESLSQSSRGSGESSVGKSFSVGGDWRNLLPTLGKTFENDLDSPDCALAKSRNQCDLDEFQGVLRRKCSDFCVPNIKYRSPRQPNARGEDIIVAELERRIRSACKFRKICLIRMGESCDDLKKILTTLWAAEKQDTDRDVVKKFVDLSSNVPYLFKYFREAESKMEALKEAIALRRRFV